MADNKPGMRILKTDRKLQKQKTTLGIITCIRNPGLTGRSMLSLRDMGSLKNRRLFPDNTGFSKAGPAKKCT